MIKIDWDGNEYKLESLDKEINKFKRAVVRAARLNLSKLGKNATGNLSKRITIEVVVNKFSISVTPDAGKSTYWDFVDQGVQGVMTNRKAPDSPFRFGTETGPKGKLVPAIDRWTVVKPVMDVRDKKGRFIPRKRLVRMIARNVYLHGLETTNFVSEPLMAQWAKREKDIMAALADDIGKVVDKIVPSKVTLTLK